MTGNHDGSLDDYLNELLRIGPESDRIWEKCEGYTGRASFADFINTNSCKAQAVFIAVRNETVENVRNRIVVRQKIQDLLDLNGVVEYLDRSELKPLLNRLYTLSSPPSFWRALGLIGLKFWGFVEAVLSGILDLLRRIGLELVMLLARILGAPEQKRQTGEYIGVEVDQERTRLLTLPEVINGQNHLHLLSTVRGGALRLLRLRIVLFLADLTFRFLFPPGFLADIRTIHFAHWAIVDNGKRLLFVTHYDGSFDNYLGDFADRAGPGLNSIWNNVKGYPIAGGVDLVAFKQFFRNDQQLPSQVFYRAYPDVSVQNRLRDRDITRQLANQLNLQSVEDWLSLL